MADITMSLKGRTFAVCAGRSCHTGPNPSPASFAFKCLFAFESSVRRCSIMIHVADTTKGKPMKLFYILSLIFSMTAVASAETTTIRDRNGSIVSTGTIDSNGQRTWRDGNGRMIGTATTDSNGTTTIRDSQGRISGTEERRR
jgi:hypothetical protein